MISGDRTDGSDSGEWTYVTNKRKNKGKQYRKSVGTSCNLGREDGNVPSTCSNCKADIPFSQAGIITDIATKSAGKVAEQLSNSAQEYKEQLKQAVDSQIKVGNAIKDGQKELEKVVQIQASMIEGMARKHNDGQLTCIAQVSGLCNSVVDVMGAKLDMITNELTKMSDNLNDLIAQIGHMIESNEQQPRTDQNNETPSAPMRSSQEQQTHRTRQFERIDQTHAAPVQQQIVGMFDQYLDKEKRKNNVVVFNLPESTCQTNSDRMKEDVNSFIQMVREDLHLSVSVSKCFRVGKRVDTRPRLLIVSLESEWDKWDVLRQAPLLKYANRSPRVFINPDLSVHERVEAKRLREELAKRKASGETNIKIQRGRIVHLKSSSVHMSQSTAAPRSDTSNSEPNELGTTISRSEVQGQQQRATVPSASTNTRTHETAKEQETNSNLSANNCLDHNSKEIVSLSPTNQSLTS